MANLRETIRPSADLRNHYNEISKQCREEKEAELARKLSLLESQGAASGQTSNAGSVEKSAVENGPQINEMQDKLTTAVLTGNRNGIVTITKEALESGQTPSEL